MTSYPLKTFSVLFSIRQFYFECFLTGLVDLLKLLMKRFKHSAFY
jgi:hypothetical protein